MLEAKPNAMLGNWSARERQYRDKLKGGDVLTLASVVRDLAWRASASRLSAREDDLHGRTRRLLASELGCALGIDVERAFAYIDELVSVGRRLDDVQAPPALP